MTKVVINRCYGGFGLSEEAFDRLLNAKGITFEKVTKKSGLAYGPDYYHAGHLGDDDFYISEYEFRSDDKRDDPDLVRIVEELGDAANGRFAELGVVEIPDGVTWYISDYDGIESIHEHHRSWS